MKPNTSYIIGSISTKVGNIPQIATKWNTDDYIGQLKVRSAIGRGHYTVEPGLYAVGTPNETSDVLVTANYKLTFDIVRKNLDGLNVWLLVLDTKGVNVWCAAGKKTFGTSELVRRIKEVSLYDIVTHRRIIVPQLGAPGISAAEVRKASTPIQKTDKISASPTISAPVFSGFSQHAKADSGFKVIFGPVRANDIKKFISGGYKASRDMRTVKFTFADRLILIPVEFVLGFKYIAAIVLIFILLSGVNNHGFSVNMLINNILPITLNSLAAYIAGTVVAPLLLPYLPFRSFSMKGFTVGLASFALMYSLGTTGGWIQSLAWLFVFSALPAFMTMNFTGTSNYTSLSGVLKEMKIAVPLQISVGALALISFVVSRFF